MMRTPRRSARLISVIVLSMLLTAACAGAGAPAAASPTAGPIATGLPAATGTADLSTPPAATPAPLPSQPGLLPSDTPPASPSAPTQPPATSGAPTTPPGVNVCPAAQAPAGASATPAVRVGGTGRSLGGSASLSTGQVLEVRLAASTRWTLTPPNPANVLTPLAGNGWYDAAGRSCVWQFTAQAPGTVKLDFNGRAICQAGAVCPNFVLLAEFVVTVK